MPASRRRQVPALSRLHAFGITWLLNDNCRHQFLAPADPKITTPAAKAFDRSPIELRQIIVSGKPLRLAFPADVTLRPQPWIVIPQPCRHFEQGRLRARIGNREPQRLQKLARYASGASRMESVICLDEFAALDEREVPAPNPQGGQESGAGGLAAAAALTQLERAGGCGDFKLHAAARATASDHASLLRKRPLRAGPAELSACTRPCRGGHGLGSRPSGPRPTRRLARRHLALSASEGSAKEFLKEFGERDGPGCQAEPGESAVRNVQTSPLGVSQVPCPPKSPSVKFSSAPDARHRHDAHRDKSHDRSGIPIDTFRSRGTDPQVKGNVAESSLRKSARLRTAE